MLRIIYSIHINRSGSTYVNFFCITVFRNFFIKIRKIILNVLTVNYEKECGPHKRRNRDHFRGGTKQKRVGVGEMRRK